MSEPSSAPDLDEAFLLQFQQEHEAAADKGTVVEKYAVLRPDLAKRIRARAAIAPLLGGMSPTPADPMPEWLGEFHILREVGRGGMGRIYEAWHKRLDRRVAVKAIRPDRASAEARERFRREQQALARLHQTHIVSIYQIGEEGPVQYFAMPYIDGAALHHVVRAALQHETARPRGQTPTLGKLAEEVSAAHDPSTLGSTVDEPPRSPAPPADADADAVLNLSEPYFRSVAEALADAAEALHHAHAARLLHRDVKPSNLMVDKGGRCWLIDFGLAGLLAGPAGAAADPLASAVPVTTLGLLGTPQYMAPEQWTGDKLNARTDVWGLGVTLYEMLTLRQAFSGPTGEVRDKILKGEPVAPRRLVGNVPADLAAICRKAMRKRAYDRYPTALAFADDLRRWLRGEPTAARPAAPARRAWMWARRNRGWATAIAITIASAAALAVGAFFVVWNRAAAADAKAAGARDREQEQQRQVLMQKLQQPRLTARSAGWYEGSKELVHDAAKIRADADLRDQAAADLTGFDAHPIKTLYGFGASALAWSPGGKRLLIGGSGKYEGRVWNLDHAGDDPVLSGQAGEGPVGFRDDETPLQLVLSGREGELLRLWDADKRKTVGSFETDDPSKYEVVTMVMAANGSFVAAALAPKGQSDKPGKSVLALWDSGKRKPIKLWEVSASALAFTPDGAILAAAEDRTHAIILWSVPKGERLVELPASHITINCLAFGRNPCRRNGDRGKPGPEANWLLASGATASDITVWDPGARSVRSRCFGAQYDVNALSFSPDGATLLSVGRYNPVLWDAATGRPLLHLGYHNTFAGAAFSPDGRYMAVGSLPLHEDAPYLTCGLEVWTLENGRGVKTLLGPSAQVERLLYSPDGKCLAGLAQNWQIAVWEAESGRLLHLFDAPEGMFADNSSMVFSPDGKRLTFSTGRNAAAWDLTTGEQVGSWPLPPGLQDALAINADGKVLLLRVETEDGKVFPDSDHGPAQFPRVCRLRELEKDGKALVIKEIPDFKSGMPHIRASPDGRFFLVKGPKEIREGETKTALVCFASATGEVLWEKSYKEVNKSVYMTLYPDGKRVAVELNWGEDSALVLDTSNGAFIELGGHIPNSQIPSTRYRVEENRELYRYGRKDPPLVALDLGARSAHGGGLAFDAKDEHLAFNSRENWVSVCDIEAVRRRLSDMGLGFGW